MWTRRRCGGRKKLKSKKKKSRSLYEFKNEKKKKSRVVSSNVNSLKSENKSER